LLKLQKPSRLDMYEKLDASRINELHLAGFIPEYLYGLYVYFRKSAELTSFLNNEVKEPEFTSGYLQVESDEAYNQDDWVTTTNVDPESEPMVINLQPEKKEYKTKKMVIEKEVSEDE